MPCSRLPGHGRRGQVLLVAVLLLGAILLLGALFVAIVQYNQFQATRHSSVVVAQNLAEAGIKYADYMLQTSSRGADWRPPKPPMMDVSTNTYDPGFAGSDGVVGDDDDYYLPDEQVRGYFGEYDSSTNTLVRLGYTRYPDTVNGTADLSTVGNQGHVLLRVTYDPGPPFEPMDGATPKVDNMSKYIRIDSIGVVPALVPIMRHMVAWKPIGLTDHLFWVTDKDHSNKPAYFGCRPAIDFNGDGVININTTAGLPVTQRGEFLANLFDGPIRVNTRLEFVGNNADNWLGTAPTPDQASNQVTLVRTPIPPNGFLRDDTLQVRQGITDLTPAQTWAQSAGVTMTSYTGGATTSTAPAWIYQSSDPAFDTYSGAILDGSQRLQDVNGNSRMVKRESAPDLFTPDPATGVDRYREVSRDIGPLVTTPAGQVHLGALGLRDGTNGGGMYIDNFNDIQFARSDGSHDLQSLIEDWLREIPEGDPRGAQSGWNALYTVYSPPGVEIQLFASEAAVVASAGGAAIVTDPDNPPTTAAGIWWPYHVAGQPGIKLTRHDHHWYTATGADSGLNTMYIDYPSSLSFVDSSAGGATNITRTDAVIFAEGNVRIKGVLPPADVLGPPANLLVHDYNLTVVSGGTIYIDGQILSPKDVDPTLPDERNTHIALLARDDVCLNPTMLVPQLTSGMVPAGPDDPANPDPDRLHWALSGGNGTIYTSFDFGEPPAAGDQLRLDVIQSAADPGPSGVGMTIDNGAALANYDFGGGALTYALMPPGSILPGPGSYTIAPTWEKTGWPIGTYLSTAPGAYNTISLFHRDPGVAPGSTDYWLKRLKIQEWSNVGGAGTNWQPVATLHAHIDALVYAQNGSWFIIPGSYYDPTAVGANAAAMRRYNYQITFRGAITENNTASADATRDWMDKWSYPIWVTNGGTLSLCWGSIVYQYDDSLREGRAEPPCTVSGNIRTATANPHFSASDPSFVCLWNLPRLPMLPVSPDLIYYGEY